MKQYTIYDFKIGDLVLLDLSYPLTPKTLINAIVICINYQGPWIRVLDERGRYDGYSSCRIQHRR